MRLDDRSADGEPHAHAVGFRREEGLEDAISGRRIHSRTRILDRNKHAARFGTFRRYRQYLRAIHDRAHGFNAVHDQIEHNLLQLNPIPEDHTFASGQIGVKRNMVLSQLAAGERQNFLDGAVDIEAQHFLPVREGFR